MEEEAVGLAQQAERYFAENDFEKSLEALRRIQELVSPRKVSIMQLGNHEPSVADNHLFEEENDMVQLTMQVSDELAKQIQPIGSWLPTIIELSLIGFKTLATATATEVIQFLSKAPSPQDVLNYHVSKQAQERLQRLLALNEAGMLSETEQLEHKCVALVPAL